MVKINIFVVFVVFQISVGLVDACTSYHRRMVLRIDNKSELREARAAHLNFYSDSGWLLLNYVGPNTVHFAAGGKGRAAEFIPHLKDDQIQYVLFRVKSPSVAGQGGVRDVFIQWIGPRVDKVEKEKKATLLHDVGSILYPFHTTMKVACRANFNDETIIERTHPFFERIIID